MIACSQQNSLMDYGEKKVDAFISIGRDDPYHVRKTIYSF